MRMYASHMHVICMSRKQGDRLRRAAIFVHWVFYSCMLYMCIYIFVVDVYTDLRIHRYTYTYVYIYTYVFCRGTDTDVCMYMYVT